MTKAEIGVFVITSMCTLKCKKCVTFTPYKKQPHHEKTETLFKSIREFFKVYDYVDHIDLEGGEPLLHPDLSEIINEFMKYQTQFAELRVLTNGTVMPSNKIWDEWEELGEFFFLIIDNYGGLSPKVEMMVQEAEKRNIRYRIDQYCGNDQYCGGWIDMTDLSELIHPTEELKEKTLRSCRQGNYQEDMMKPYIADGKLCLCSAQVAMLPHIPFVEGEYVDLLDGAVSLEEKRRIVTDFGKKPVASCAYCKGFDVKNGARCPAAEQL